jgi:DNA repair exonuclease SbcCD nuclease subunit
MSTMTASRDESGAERAPLFRFVHCSDVHLDTPFACSDAATRGKLAEASRATFTRLVDLCLAEQVSALLVAGDLLDDERLSLATEEWMLAQLARLTQGGVTVVLACGNHDSAMPGGRMSSLAFPDGVHVAGSEPLTVDVRDAEGRLLGRVCAAGHGSSKEGTRLAATLPAADEGVPSVGLVHGFFEGARGGERHERLALCDGDELELVGHRYWALGHVHLRQQLGRKPVAHYPGCLVPHGFAEDGAHGALLVSLPPKSEPKVEFRALCPVRFERPAIAGLEAVRDLQGLRAACVRAFETLRGGESSPDARWMLRFELSGPCAAAAEVQRDELMEELSEELTGILQPFGVLHVEVTDAGVSRPVALAEHAGRPHLLGEALAVAAALDDDTVLDRLCPAPAAGCAEDADKRAYVRGLLGGIDRAAAEALVKPAAEAKVKPAAEAMVREVRP